ncbi:MAG TPA: zinc-ribbon domain-containing protein [Chloroflexia bacterium]|nr:zinc-ribbon domain-containing protein [Chloroflexia bacterium]
MVQNCPRCGTPNVAGHRYCSNCGARMLEDVKPDASDIPNSASSASIPHVAASEMAEMPGSPGADLSRPGSVGTPGRPMISSARVELPPNAGENGGQATFVPYTSDVTNKLEKEKPGNSWLKPTIGVAAAILAILVVVTIYLLLANNSSKPGLGVAGQPEALVFPKEVPLPCSLPAGATAEQEIIYTVCRSSEEQVKAWRDLDTEVLKSSRTGGDLELNIREVEELRAKNQYRDPVLHRLVIVAMTSDGATAQVQTSEVWSVTTYNKADKSIVNQKNKATYAETYQLVKQGSKWFVEKVEFNNTAVPGD